MSWKRASIWVLGILGTLLGTVLTTAAGEVWASKADHEKRLDVLETKDADDRVSLKDLQTDVKEILRRLPQP